MQLRVKRTCESRVTEASELFSFSSEKTCLFCGKNMKVFVRLCSGDIVSQTVEPEAAVVDTLKTALADRLGPHPERIAVFIGSRRVGKADQFEKYKDSNLPIFEMTRVWRGLSTSESDDFAPEMIVAPSSVDAQSG